MPTGPYEIIEITASGGYGTVCVARPAEAPERLVVLKVLRNRMSENAGILARTRDEARLLYRLRHPDIVQVETLVEVGGRPVLVMEWVEGMSVDRLLHVHRDGLPFPVAAEVVRRTAGALHAAWHSPDGPEGPPLQVLHRDVKPANLLLSVDGRVKVVDFGTAHAGFSDREATTISTILGSKSYLAPERLDGVAATITMDVYSLGITFFEMLTGHLLVLPNRGGRRAEALRTQLAHLKPGGLKKPDQEMVRDLVFRMCSAVPEQRPEPIEVAATLQVLLQRHPADLPAFADAMVRPLYEARPRVPPHDHPDYDEVAFLEAADLATEETALEPTDASIEGVTQRADRRVRRFLERPDWPEQLRDLRWLLATNPAWTASPFLDLLQGASRPWWRFWSPALPPGAAAAALEILKHRRTEAVLARARALADAPDPAVARAARELLQDEG